jgi:hypothetical protein
VSPKELVDLYERERGAFDVEERRAIAAVVAWRAAVFARFEHARAIPDDERVLCPSIETDVGRLLSLWRD